MLSHLLLPQIEADAAQRGKQSLGILRANQARNKMAWALFTGSTLFAFLIVLVSLVGAERHGIKVVWIASGIGAALAIVAISEHLRTNPVFLTRQTINFWRLVSNLRYRNRGDFLFLHAWAAYILVLTPAFLSVFVIAVSTQCFAKPGTTLYMAHADELKQLITLTALLLTAQIALFNFVFAQLLGKYSSAIAVAVSQHRAVRLLRSYSLALLVVLYGLYSLGFPDALPKVTFVAVFSLVSSLAITVWVSNVGIRIDRAILYFGRHNALRLARSLGSPILKRTRFWNVMGQLGLDWRSPARMVVTLPPEQPAANATAIASGLFNAAHKSIQENQHETFLSSLQALMLIVEAYVSKRRQYFGSTDHFLGYLNDQLAAVVKAAAKSSNEYMAMNAVTFIGRIGSQALELGRGPSPRRVGYPESHPYFGHWLGLLRECFDLTHRLMRSTAASESLTQLTRLTKKAVDLGYGEDALLTFPSEVKRIYTICLTTPDPYHLSLAGECVSAMTDVWDHCLSKNDGALAGITKAMCDALKKMALAFQTIEKLPSVNLSDPVTRLTSKLTEGGVTLQDIALSILTRPVKEQWQRESAADDLSHLLITVSELLKDVVTRDLAFAKHYGDAFYELALLILIGLPSQWNEVEPAAERHIEQITAQERFETDLGATIKDLIPLYRGARTLVRDWEQEIFSIIGMAAAVYAETGRETARLVAIEAISCYRDTLAADNAQEHKTVHDDDWDYLQLVSVWARHLLKDDALADELVDAVAKGRPFHFSFVGLSGKHGWGVYGYPDVSFLDYDFHLPRPRNIAHRLGDSVRQTLIRWQDRLMNPDQLMDTYDRIEKIREPIRQRMMESYRLEMERRRTAKATKAAQAAAAQAEPTKQNKDIPAADSSERPLEGQE